MRRAATGPPTIGDWLGVNGRWPGPDGEETIEDYLLGHTRLIPRDIISLGNELNEEVLRQKQAGHEGLPPEALQAVVQRCAKRFGDSQPAQCANQISSDLMPKNAALHDYSELFTSTQAYITGVQEDLRSFVRMIGVDRFPRADLEARQEVADLHFEQPTDLASVLWQNGLARDVTRLGGAWFNSMRHHPGSPFPPDFNTSSCIRAWCTPWAGSGTCGRTPLAAQQARAPAGRCLRAQRSSRGTGRCTVLKRQQGSPRT